MTMRASLFLSTALLAGASAAYAQFGNPGFANPATPGIETGKPSGDAANTTDIVYLQQASIGNQAEVEIGNLAGERASAASVKDFARRMVADHRKGADSLRNLARDKGTPLPRELDVDHDVVLGQLRQLNGADFDVAYIRAQIVDHQKTAQLLSYEIGGGQSDAVRRNAQESLPMVVEHLEMAKRIHAELTGAAP
jgi:putative membrane protein